MRKRAKGERGTLKLKRNFTPFPLLDRPTPPNLKTPKQTPSFPTTQCPHLPSFSVRQVKKIKDQINKQNPPQMQFILRGTWPEKLFPCYEAPWGFIHLLYTCRQVTGVMTIHCPHNYCNLIKDYISSFHINDLSSSTHVVGPTSATQIPWVQ